MGLTFTGEAAPRWRWTRRFRAIWDIVVFVVAAIPFTLAMYWFSPDSSGEEVR